MKTNHNPDKPKVGKWTGAENTALVSAYFSMMKKDAAGVKFSKTAVRNELIGSPEKPGPLAFRSHGSIECKLMNVSGCLRSLGRLTLRGYAPAMNYQSELMTEVCRALGIKSDSQTPAA